MPAEKISTLLRTDDIRTSVAFWKDILGVEPTFVDGDRWAQFDVGSTRLSLGSPAEAPTSAVSVKMLDLTPALARLAAAGIAFETVEGTHETQVRLVDDDENAIVLYQPK